MKRKRPKLVVLDPEDFSEIALEKSAQRPWGAIAPKLSNNDPYGKPFWFLKHSPGQQH
jgi:hypothetical protein